MGKADKQADQQGHGEEKDAYGRACPTDDVIRSRMRELRGQPIEKIMKVLSEMCNLPLATYIIQLLVDALGYDITGQIVEEQKKYTKQQPPEPEPEPEPEPAPEPQKAPQPRPKKEKAPKKVRRPKKGDRGSIGQMVVKVKKTPKHIGANAGELSRGDTYEVLETQGDWAKIRSGDIEGWINNATITTPQGESVELTTEPGGPASPGFDPAEDGGAARN